MLRQTCLAGTLLLASAGAVLSQARAEIVGPIAEIPRQPYKTWALFLICNPDWVAPQRAGDLANLYWRFRSFGDAIGKDNLAVWFWTKRTSIDDPHLADAVNVARSADYCVKLKLRPTAGPYVVVTSEYPDLDAFPRDRAIFELGGLGPADVAKLLNALTDELVLEGKVDAARAAARSPAAPAPAAASPSDTSSLWIRLLEGARRSMIGFGCSTSIKIDTGALSAELRECPTR